MLCPSCDKKLQPPGATYCPWCSARVPISAGSLEEDREALRALQDADPAINNLLDSHAKNLTAEIDGDFREPSNAWVDVTQPKGNAQDEPPPPRPTRARCGASVSCSTAAADRSRAYLQGSYRDAFRGGLYAAMNGNFWDWFQDRMRDSSFNALAKVLDRLADRFADMLFDSRQGSGGGFLAAIGGLLGLGGGSSSSCATAACSRPCASRGRASPCACPTPSSSATTAPSGPRSAPNSTAAPRARP